MITWSIGKIYTDIISDTIQDRMYTVSQKNVNDVAHYNFNAH